MKIKFLTIFVLLTALACTNQVGKGVVTENENPLSKKKTKIVAHRGFSGVAPENTLAAFRKAVEVGADYFELDVHHSKDGQLIVIHDDDVSRTTSNKSGGTVEKMTLAELDLIRVGYREKFGDAFSDEKIPTLKEALLVAKGSPTKVCIEIKVTGVETKVLALVNELKMKNQVIIFSFLDTVLVNIRKLDKNIPILYLIDRADEATVTFATSIQANAIGVGYATKPTKEYIQFANSKGIEVWKWTVNEESQMKELINMGLDGMITNYPDKAMLIVKQ